MLLFRNQTHYYIIYTSVKPYKKITTLSLHFLYLLAPNQQSEWFYYQQYNVQMNLDQKSIGMMEGAFFVPKGDLINWVNNTLHINLNKIEQLGTGAVYCHLLDAMHPGKLPMQRVNWKARNQWENIVNLKILQQTFTKCGIQKHIEIQKLSKCKYQDNLEFIQWLKRYFDLYNKNDLTQYDPVAARRNIQIDLAGFDFKPKRQNKTDKIQKEDDRKEKIKNPTELLQTQYNKVSNKSLPPKKNKRKNPIYAQKLSKIRQIMASNRKQGDKLSKIQQILQQMQEDLPNLSNIQQSANDKIVVASENSKTRLQLPKIQKLKIRK